MKLKKLACPGCGASIDYIEDKDFFFCTYCGSRVAADDEGNNLVKLKKQIIQKTEIPKTDCECCSGTIFLQREKKYKCLNCGKIVCEDCYNSFSNLCKICLNEKMAAEKKRKLPDQFIKYFIIITMFASFLHWCIACQI